jgi:hypothetical protein
MTITLLKEEQIWGEDALNVIKDYGTSGAISDLAVFLGGLQSARLKTSDGLRTAWLWSASSSRDGHVRIVD